MTDLKAAPDGTVELPAMQLPPAALLAITSPSELAMHLKAGSSLVVIDPPEGATAASEPSYRLSVRGQDTFRVSSRIAKAFIGDGRVAVVGLDHLGRKFYLITMKGRA